MCDATSPFVQRVNSAQFLLSHGPHHSALVTFLSLELCIHGVKGVCKSGTGTYNFGVPKRPVMHKTIR